jgi:hypothetical protein
MISMGLSPVGLFYTVQFNFNLKSFSIIFHPFLHPCTHLRSVPHCHNMGKNTRPYFNLGRTFGIMEIECLFYG